jgi:hypothetical protein
MTHVIAYLLCGIWLFVHVGGAIVSVFFGGGK